MGDLTTNFSRHEFRCHGQQCCGGSAPVSLALVQALQELRDYIGLPLRINSGFRCVIHNRNVGGTLRSQHTLGLAADVAPPQGVDVYTLAQMAETVDVFRRGGIGIYPDKNFVHLDVRPDGQARWPKEIWATRMPLVK